MRKVLICFLLVLVTACVSSKPNRFYSLASNEPAGADVVTKKLLVGIDTVSVPGYLERPQIVTIKNNSELNLAEFDRWAEPISNALQRIIASNMSSVMKNAMVKPASVNRRSFNYIVSVEFNKLDGRFNDKVLLEAWWTVVDNNGRIVVNETSRYEAPLGDNYDELVEKQSELVSKLSVDIAKRIGRLK
ncbi:MAG: PqiC family protein [Lactobacillaceae bacterium]|jgi:uncharacterized lipoprotein YmbA|nr:PqiC family protein [Lactobacillaceae bacterium]